MARRNKMYTIYDRMEEAGVFESNPANAGARNDTGELIYTGPQKFPKMLYHPQGKTRVTVPAELVSTPFGPERRGEQREIISKIVRSEDELEAAKAEGWHEHPSDALAAGLTPEERAMPGAVPAKSSASRAQELELQMAAMQKELAAARAELASRPQAPSED